MEVPCPKHHGVGDPWTMLDIFQKCKIIRQHTHSTQISSPAFPHPLQILFNLWVCWIPREAPAAGIQTPLRWLRSPPSHGRTTTLWHGRNTAVDKIVSRAGLCVTERLSRTGSHLRHGAQPGPPKTVSQAPLELVVVVVMREKQIPRFVRQK